MSDSLPVFLVKGDDPVLVGEATRMLVAELVGERPADLVVHEQGEDAQIASIIETCQTPPFLVDRRVIVVKGAGRFRADQVEPLIEYLASPLPSTVLVMVAGGGALPTRLLNAIKKHGRVTDASVPTGKGRHAWVAERIGHAPVKLRGDAVALITDHLGEELGQLTGLLDALTAAYGQGASLGSADVLPFLGAAGAAAPWELLDAIDGGDTATALRQLHRMLDGGGRHPLVVMATLQRHVITLLRLDGSGVVGEREAAALTGLAPYPAKKALNQARVLGSGQIKRAVRLVAEADVDLRGKSGLAPSLVLEILVARLSRLSGSKSARFGREAG